MEEEKQKWAYCYRVGCGINTNMNLERWHRELKYKEGEGRVLRRLDKSLSLILNAVSKKLMGRLTPIERGKLTSKISTIRMRHDKSCNEIQGYSIEELTPIKWVVYKTVANGITTYEINKVKDCDCPIRCHTCKICIHSLACNCVDYSVKFTIYEDSNRLRREKVKGVILKEKEKSVVLEEPVELVYERVERNMQLVNDVKNMANAEHIKRFDQALKNFMKSIGVSPFCSSLSSIERFPANKKIDQQRQRQELRYFKKQKLDDVT
ncbi:uncharacterized protein TNCT_591611 [Trichonephila clavata]|uniref:SWIM-type domain-containing protein n=1 Tax=Trichonephila clavata TaxID=2740835 RepID=A0A8X6M302_TRICU|nr:uncharacterized protein TNCT_591611 [Trichonephila clavata]